ncbi:hypothetical protein FACS1894166_00860 [Bacilli bacterium]|nr:hypothetical protein FACS1894166_00860 [Bacilli bacterium]
MYADNGVELPERNVLLDLAKFKVDKGITDQVDFVIDGTIDFGILVGFDENIYLYGETDSLMDINVTTNAFGIVVGSQIDPASTISYTGTMNIDNSVHCIIYSTVDAYGVYFHSNVVGDTTINGVFTISFSSGSSADAYGVSFFETVSGDTTINGVFIISSSISAYGTFFLGDVSGDTTINGVFTISSADVHGVLFVGDVSGDTTINGVFTIYANNAYGTFFLGDVSGDTTINGVFTIISIYSPTGVYFNSTISGDTTINGIFTISSSSSASASGVYFECTPTGELSGVPNFYSNKVDSGD